MKEIKSERLDEIEEMAMRAMRYLDHFVSKYDGKDPKMVQRVKPAMMIAGTWSRLRATEANRMAIERTFAERVEELPEQKRKALAKAG
jgi:hypothetical protein